MRNRKKIIILLMTFLLGIGIFCVGIAGQGSLFLNISNKGFQFEKLDEVKIVTEQVSDSVRKLQIDVDYLDVAISEGDAFEVQYNPAMTTVIEQNGELVIKDRDVQKNHANRVIVSVDLTSSGNVKQAVHLTIPKEQQIEECKMSSVSGNLSIENQDFSAMQIENTYGNIKVSDSVVQLFTSEQTSGSLTCIDASIDKMKVRNTYGDVKLQLVESKEAYAVEAMLRYGKLKYDGKEVASDIDLGNGNKKLELALESGNLEITFNQ